MLIPITINAQDIDYDITNYYIKANILENGDMEVNELIVMDGTFNGYEREITYKNSVLDNYSSDTIDFEHDAIYNASGISNYECYAKYVNSVSFDTFNENFTKLNVISSTFNATKGDVYINDSYDTKIFRMYYRADEEKVAFLIKYTVDSAVVMHNDIAELYYTFIGEEFDDDINDIQIRIYLPNEDSSDYFRVWGHGDLTGEVNMVDNSYIEAKIENLYANNSIDIRTTFDKSLITDDANLNHSYVDAFDKIIEVEKQRADEANKKRAAAKKTYRTWYIVSIIMFIWQIISVYLIYKKYDKEYKSDFTNDYYREFIDDYNVEVVDYIMNKSITPNAMSASIMNLIYKKNIKAERIENEKKEEYEFTLLNRDNLNDTENTLVDFLFEKIGSSNTFTTKQLKEYAKSTKTYDEFTNSYTKWKNKVVKEGKNLKIFENHIEIIPYAIIMVAILYLIRCYVTYKNALNIFCLINPWLAIAITIYCLIFKKRSVYGNEQYVRLKALKKFLNDFGEFSIKELPEINLWERYMVYATVFGIANKVAKTMNVKIKELETSGTYIDTYNPYYFHCHLADTINTSVASAVTSAQRTASELASSNSSSGSGFGGGFSSGGGFGGGGGGGHGF
jgi:uncharacterized membrane protein